MSDLDRAISSLANAIVDIDFNEKKIPITTLANRLSVAMDTYPGDSVIASMSDVFNKMASKNEFQLLSRKNVQDVFDVFAGQFNTENVRTVLADVLVPNLRTGKINQSDDRVYGSSDTRSLSDIRENKSDIVVDSRALPIDIPSPRPEFVSVANEFVSSVKSAKSKYSKEVVASALKFIGSELSKFANQMPLSVDYVGDCDGGITATATLLGKYGKKVVAIDLTVLDSSGTFAPVDSYKVAGRETKLTKLAISNELNDIDNSVVENISSNQSYTELLHDLHSAVEAKDMAMSRVIMSTIQSKFADRYVEAVNLYQGMLLKAATSKQCSMIIAGGKNSNSVRDICGHLRLPLDQVSVDESGHCVRKSMQAFKDSAKHDTSFSSSKILMS